GQADRITKEDAAIAIEGALDTAANPAASLRTDRQRAKSFRVDQQYRIVGCVAPNVGGSAHQTERVVGEKLSRRWIVVPRGHGEQSTAIAANAGTADEREQ